MNTFGVRLTSASRGLPARMRCPAVALLGVLAVIFANIGIVSAQTTSGSISGTATDPQGGVVASASVQAFHEQQKVVQQTSTDGEGHFVFPMLPPGTYSVTVQAPGFKVLKKTGVTLNANTELTLGKLQLEIGGTSQTVEVSSVGQEVQTDSAQRGDSIVGSQINNIQVNGQSPLFFLSLVPGVYNPASYVESTQQYGGTYVNGNRSSTMHVTVNGGTNQDTGGNSGWMAPLSLDSVQEVKVLTSSYQAEYGRSSGAQISIVTKSGTSEFHGTGFEYFRDRGLNANTWTNNRVGLAKPGYHYNDAGFNFGGPIYIPGKFNTDHSRLFFFVDEQWQHQLVPTGQQRVTVPTALERTGNFSQSADKNGNPIVVRDPATNQPFPGNTIPAALQSGPGVQLLNLLPAPNSIDISHPDYNYVSQRSVFHPRREDTLRVDYNLGSKWRFYGSLLKAADNETTPYGIWGTTNIPLYDLQYSIPGYHYVLNATTTISPTAVNEIMFDQGHDEQYNGTKKGSTDWTRTATGVDMNTLYTPYQDLIAGFGFGGSRIANSPTFNTSSYPFYNANTNTELVDNFSKIFGAHTLKLGLYFDHNWKVQPSGANYAGAYDFGDNPSNPLDTGYGFANAALGVFNSFTQASAYVATYPIYNQWEWYAQDTWKVNKRLTLNYGVRFYAIQPIRTQKGQLSNFFANTWSSAAAPVLLRPGLNGEGQRIAVDPLTGTTYPAVNIGRYLPSSGDPQNGIVILGQNGVSSSITKSAGILPAARFGLAYDLTGRQNLVFRLGGGMFYDRTATDPYASLVGNPPNTVQPSINYGQIASLTTATSVLSPPSLSVFSNSSAMPVTYNYNAGIQAKLPLAVLLDVSYVGSISNHLLQRMNLNPVSFGAAFLPQNQDPTLQMSSPNALPGSNALQSQFLRPYIGYGDINEYLFSGNSNYNSLQVSANRRFASGLFLGLAYTWSKCLNTTDGNDSIRFDGNTHTALYGPCAGNVPHNLIVHYVYTLPKLPGGSGGFNNPVTRAILNDWQISGVNTFQSGTPYSLNFSAAGVSGVNFTGTPSWNPVPLCVADPSSGTSDSPYNRINATALALPAVGSIGLGCSRNLMYGPGAHNWDFSLQKNIPLGERFHMEMRGEAFNVFNHTQFSGVNSTINYSGLSNPVVTNLPFNTAGQLTNLNGFGTVSGVRSPRILQLVAKFVF